MSHKEEPKPVKESVGNNLGKSEKAERAGKPGGKPEAQGNHQNGNPARA